MLISSLPVPDLLDPPIEKHISENHPEIIPVFQNLICIRGFRSKNRNNSTSRSKSHPKEQEPEQEQDPPKEKN